MESTAVVISTEGREDAAVSVTRNGRTIAIQRRGGKKPWSLCLRNVATVASVGGGSFEGSAEGTIILPDAGAESLVVTL